MQLRFCPSCELFLKFVFKYIKVFIWTRGSTAFWKGIWEKSSRQTSISKFIFCAVHHFWAAPVKLRAFSQMSPVPPPSIPVSDIDYALHPRVRSGVPVTGRSRASVPYDPQPVFILISQSSLHEAWSFSRCNLPPLCRIRCRGATLLLAQFNLPRLESGIW